MTVVKLLKGDLLFLGISLVIHPKIYLVKLLNGKETPKRNHNNIDG